jgi:tricarballylate dehydrogenase
MAAAISAAESGGSVIVLDKAPESSMGGNTRFSGGALRSPAEHVSADDLIREAQVLSHGRAIPKLVEILYRNAAADVEWLKGLGVQVGPAQAERPDLRGKIAWHIPGNGYGLVSSLYPKLREYGIDVRFEHKATKLLQDYFGKVVGVQAKTTRGFKEFHGNVVIATGNFQANAEMRTRYLGPTADSLIVRGSRYNTGDGLGMAAAVSAELMGNWGDFHSAVLDARSVPVECGETNINTYPYTVMVNINGERFLDEGAAFFDTTYVQYGKAVLRQPGGKAFCIFDAKMMEQDLVFGLCKDFEPIHAGTLSRLAEMLGINSKGLEATIAAFNAAVQPGEFDPERLDGKSTRGLSPDKSNWSLPIDTAPYFALPVTGGITFAFGGLRVDSKSRVIDTEDRVIPGLFAAGEILGGFFFQNYPGGASLVRSLVFGRIAGINAAQRKKREDRAA